MLHDLLQKMFATMMREIAVAPDITCIGESRFVLSAIGCFYDHGNFLGGGQLQKSVTPSLLNCLDPASNPDFLLRRMAVRGIAQMVSCGGAYMDYMYQSGTLDSIVPLLHTENAGAHPEALRVVLQFLETKMGPSRFFGQYVGAFSSLLELVNEKMSITVAPKAVRALLKIPEELMGTIGTENMVALAAALADTQIVFDTLAR